MPFHVVCHGCSYEKVYESEVAAKNDVRAHEKFTGHEVQLRIE